MDLCGCSNQGPGCQLLIDQGAGQNKTQMLCANSWGIMVSVFKCILTSSRHRIPAYADAVKTIYQYKVLALHCFYNICFKL